MTRLIIGTILALTITTTTNARNTYTTTTPKPILAPKNLLRARAACPLNKPLACRAALIHAYNAITWNKKVRRQLQQRLHPTPRIQHLAAWLCIHHGEGSWNSNTGNGYEGGLQFDSTFSHTYGPDFWRKYGTGPHAWTPRDQIIVAERAYNAGRGFNPWPATSRACGLR